MFKEIRRKSQQLTTEDCHEILKTAEYGTLATTGADNFPYAVSLNYVFHNGNIYFHCAKTGHKLDNIQHCPNVSFNVAADIFVTPLISVKDSQPRFKGFNTNYRSVTIFGKAVEALGDEKLEVLHVFLKRFLSKDDYEKYREDGIKYIEKALNYTMLIKIEIMHMTGKRSIHAN